MSNTQTGLLILLVVVAVLAFFLSRRTRQQSEETQRGLGVWAEQIVSADVGAPVLKEAARHNRELRTLPEMLVSKRYGLVGKPDYALEGAFYRPIEKKTRQSNWLLDSDRAQVWAYCLLLEENGYPTMGGAVLYGNQKFFEVPYGPAERSRVVTILEEMRRWQQVPARRVPKREGPQCRNCKWRRNCTGE